MKTPYTKSIPTQTVNKTFAVFFFLGALSSCLQLNSTPTKFSLLDETTSTNNEFEIPTDDKFITYKATVTSENISEYNLILFVDNSQSMAVIKEKLLLSLTKLIHKLDGKKINIGVYPITTLLGNSMNYYTVDENKNKIFFDVTKKIYEIPGQTVFYSDSNKELFYGDKFPTYSPTYIINRFEILSTFSASEKETIMNGVLKTVNSLFSDEQTSKNSPDVPLCNMMSMIMDIDKSKYPFAKSPNQSTIYMIVTNEDDETVIDPSLPKTSILVDNCIGGKTQQYTKLNTNLTYLFAGYYYKATYEAEYIIDGVQTTIANHTPPSYGWVEDFTNYNPSIKEGDDCTQELLSKPDYIQKKLNICSPVGNCSFTGNYKLKSCQLTRFENMIGKSETLNSDIISPVQKTYCDAVDLNMLTIGSKVIPGTCHLIVSNGSSRLDSTSAPRALNDQINFFKDMNFDPILVMNDLITKQFAKNKIYYIPIINTQNDNCILTEGARKGKRYEDLSNLLGESSVSIPICATNYEDYILPFVTHNIEKTSQEITLQMEKIDQLILDYADIEHKSGISQRLKINTDYKILENKVVFISEVKNDDLIKFYLK